MAHLAQGEVLGAVAGSFAVASPWMILAFLVLPVVACLGILALAAAIGRSTAGDAVVEYTNCPACSARTPSDRRSCRDCGSALAGE
jgi:ribosomal protein L40E